MSYEAGLNEEPLCHARDRSAPKGFRVQGLGFRDQGLGNYYLRHALDRSAPKETYYKGKRDPRQRQKRPTTKETYYKRDLQKRPTTKTTCDMPLTVETRAPVTTGTRGGGVGGGETDLLPCVTWDWIMRSAYLLVCDTRRALGMSLLSTWAHTRVSNTLATHQQHISNVGHVIAVHLGSCSRTI